MVTLAKGYCKTSTGRRRKVMRDAQVDLEACEKATWDEEGEHDD